MEKTRGFNGGRKNWGGKRREISILNLHGDSAGGSITKGEGGLGGVIKLFISGYRGGLQIMGINESQC